MKKSTRVCKGVTCWYCHNSTFEKTATGERCNICGASQDRAPELGPPLIYQDSSGVDGRTINRPMPALVKRIQKAIREQREAAAE